MCVCIYSCSHLYLSANYRRPQQTISKQIDRGKSDEAENTKLLNCNNKYKRGMCIHKYIQTHFRKLSTKIEFICGKSKCRSTRTAAITPQLARRRLLDLSTTKTKTKMCLPTTNDSKLSAYLCDLRRKLNICTKFVQQKYGIAYHFVWCS